MVRALAERGIQSKPYLPAIHLMSFYREQFGHREGEFPVCEDVAARSLALPFFPAMAGAEVERVAAALRGALGQG
jgi:perosamine synthetase